MKNILIALSLLPCFTFASFAAEKTTAQKVDKELTEGAQKVGSFFEGKKEARAKAKKKKKSPTKSAVDSVNEAGDAVMGEIGEILGTQKK
jgi:hypothetical protein